MPLERLGFTTGTCAAAAAKAAALLLRDGIAPTEVDVALPNGERVKLPILYARRHEMSAEAAVRKDAGDDPDITDKTTLVATVSWTDDRATQLLAGDGVGIVTKPGLSVPPGEPAINPVPRYMIQAAASEVSSRPLRIIFSIPEGKTLAQKTFNPRLGIVGGLSIIGTTGRVRPFSALALQDALKCALSVAAACGVQAPVFVPGHIGERAARRHLRLSSEQIIEVSNLWGFMLNQTAIHSFTHLLALGHPGKLSKLIVGDWDTHSSRSTSAAPLIAKLGAQVLKRALPESATVEGIFAALKASEQKRLADAVSARIRAAIEDRMNHRGQIAVALVNMQGDWLGGDGDFSAWR